MKFKSIIVLVGLVIFTANTKEVGKLSYPISNNAVAAAKTVSGWQLYSFNGLTEKKDWQAVSNLAMGFSLEKKTPYVISSVPYREGRLASIAATVNNKVYLFGGYTVAESDQEKSMPDVYQFNPETQTFKLYSTMPTPVDDSVALVYQQRYIYLISGWHDTGNVNDVQILDTLTQKWFKGTPFPGKAVFGHAAGIIDNQLVVVDGVKVAGKINGKRQYKISPVSYSGTIDPDDFTQITWSQLPVHPGNAKYRMAAVGLSEKSQIIFAGGSDNPYNYSGIGYNGSASEPSEQVFAWNTKLKKWQKLPPLNIPTMDHRGLLNVDEKLYVVGGMKAKQQVSNIVSEYSLFEKSQ